MRRQLALLLLLALIACGKPPQTTGAEPPAPGNVTLERVAKAAEEPGEWFTTGRDFGETHYSPLDKINTGNVTQLGFAWEYATGTTRGLEATPVVVDGVMYTSGSWGLAFALDAKTGKELWRFDPEVDGQTARYSCCDVVNRGVAVWHGKVYVAALDGRLFALDAATGEPAWQVDTIADHKRGYTVTGAPRIAGDVVVIGNSGAELDARGYITAYDVATGAQRWRFYTVPGDPKLPFEHAELEMASKTWDPNSRWDVGGGGTVWDSMVYDPELDLLYVGTGNGTMWNAGARSPAGGDNLFLASILAINPKTGRLVWYYQEVPGESWDYTATQNMILADLEIDGAERKVLMQAPKSGMFYVLDRITGKVISAAPFVPITWTSGVDLATGRPVMKDQADFRTGPKLVSPAPFGGHNWHPMALNPKTGLVYIPAIEASMVYADPAPGQHPYKPKSQNVSIQFPPPGNDSIVKRPSVEPPGAEISTSAEGRASLRAWDPINQKLVWEQNLGGHYNIGGVLTTGGGLVIQGTPKGTLSIYDAASGALLHQIDTGSSIIAGATSYMIDGEQYIAVMAGLGGGANGFLAFEPEFAAYKRGNAGRILVFKLGGGETPKPALLPDDPVVVPPPVTATAEEIARGAGLFAANCFGCHFNASRRGVVPNLLYMDEAKHGAFNEIVLGGALRGKGMPQFDQDLTEADANAIHAYLIAEANKLYAATQAPASGEP